MPTHVDRQHNWQRAADVPPEAMVRIIDDDSQTVIFSGTEAEYAALLAAVDAPADPPPAGVRTIVPKVQPRARRGRP